MVVPAELTFIEWLHYLRMKDVYKAYCNGWLNNITDEQRQMIKLMHGL